MSRSGCEPCVLRKVFSVKGEATADQFVPQNRLIRFTNTVALFWPMSEVEKGCRTQLVADTASGSMMVTFSP
jgi:hypothetical protein